MRSLFFVFSKRWGQTPPVMLYPQGIPWEWLREAAPQSLPIVKAFQLFAGFHCSLCDSLKGAEPDDVLGLSPCEGSAALTNLLEFRLRSGPSCSIFSGPRAERTSLQKLLTLSSDD